MTDSQKRNQLLSAGYITFENVLETEMVDELSRVTDGLLAEQSKEDAEYYRYQGSNITVNYQHPVFARLFALPRALAALSALGFDAPKFRSGHLLSKPPNAPPLYWHQDWVAWDDECSGWEVAAQVFLMYYLTDTNRENGCLRLLPGTHRKRIPFHDELPPAHEEKIYGASLDSAVFTTHPDEVDVPVKAGDLVIGDARLLHAAHANRTNQHRSLLTLWYFPDYDSLPDSIKARTARKKPLKPPDWWEGDVGAAVEPLIPYYEGEAEPSVYNRVPGEYLGRTPGTTEPLRRRR